YEHYSREIRALQVSLRDRQSNVPKDLGKRRLRVEAFNSHLNHIQDVGRFLIAHYRESNCEIRKTPKPKYFGKPWKLEGVKPMPLPKDEESGSEASWHEVGARLLEASSELSRQHTEIVDWIEALGKSKSAADADALVAQKRGNQREPRSERPTLKVVE